MTVSLTDQNTNINAVGIPFLEIGLHSNEPGISTLSI